MSSELATSSPARLAVRRPKLKKLTQDALRTATRAAEILPRIIERIDERLPEMEDKQLVSAGHLIAGIAQHKNLVAKQAGLLKNGSETQVPQTIVNVNLRADLPFSERIKLIQAEVSGVPQILPQEAPRLEGVQDAARAVQIDAAPQVDPEVVSLPKTQPAALQAASRPLAERILDL